MNINFDEKLLKILVCPKTHTKLEFDKKNHELVSSAAGLAYPIRNGIPILLASQARKIIEKN